MRSKVLFVSVAFAAAAAFAVGYAAAAPVVAAAPPAFNGTVLAFRWGAAFFHPGRADGRCVGGKGENTPAPWSRCQACDKVTLLPEARPSRPASQRPVATSAGRSTPVAMPMPSSM